MRRARRCRWERWWDDSIYDFRLQSADFEMSLSGAIKGFVNGWRQKSSPEAAAWLRGEEGESSAGATLKSPYSQSAWVYIAISTLAENIAQIPFRICRVPASAQKQLRRGKPGSASAANFKRRVMAENIIESGPVVELFEQPHPTMNKALYWEMIITWQCLRGEFFVVPLDGQDQPVDLATMLRSGGALGSESRIARLLTIEPLLFWHMVVGYELQAWRYTGSPLITPIASQVLSPTEVIHSRAPNPFLYWRGMSPLSLAALPAASDYAAEQFMKGLMMNNADTGVIVTTEQQPSTEQREAIMAALRERKRKAGTPDRPLFLWGGSKLEKPTVSSADMQFLENRKLNRQEICAIFKVPESLIGFSDRGRSLGGGGEMEQDKVNFIESTVSPHCARLEAAHRPIVKSFGADLEGYFDVDSLPILQAARRMRIDAAQKAFGMGVPFNAVEANYDLGFGPIPGGDIGYLPFNLQPIGETGAPADSTGGDQKPEPEQNLFIRAGRLFETIGEKENCRTVELSNRRTLNGHSCAANPEYEATLEPRIKAKQSKLKRFWFEQRGRILQRLPEAMKQFREVADEVNDKVVETRWLWQPTGELQRGIDDLFDARSEDAKLLKALKPLLVSDLEHGGAQLYKEIGLGDFSLAPKDAIAFLDKRKNVISGINQTTWDKLKASLQEGLQAGEPMESLQDRVKTFFGGQEARAETIAGTETNVAVNTGRHEAMVGAGVERKGWQTSHLENTRETHAANEALSEERNGIPIDEEWPNGCLYPGDPDADAGETINCRCFGYAILTAGNE